MREVRAIAMIQRSGEMLDDAGETISRGFESELDAVQWVRDELFALHGGVEANLTGETGGWGNQTATRIVTDLGPCWGVVVEVM